MFQKILVPTDGSRYALRAAEVAADLARRYGAEVTLLLASDFHSIRTSPAPNTVKASIEQALHDANAAALAQTAAPLQQAGVKVTAREVEGAPAFVIGREAADGGYDLVVMGSRGLGLSADQRDFLGSVTERVLRIVSCPVLTVKI
jgi:nucleotide-binding universal stress UspA family protein